MPASICIFCGSRSGNDPAFTTRTNTLMALLKEKRCKVIYGGGDVGLMGSISNKYMELKGEIVGIMPHFLKELEVAHDSVKDLTFVNDMHERKALFAKLADGFIILPGGLGTMEEFFEVFCHYVLKLHRKPIAIFNINGYYDSLLTFIGNAIQKGFINKEVMDSLIIEDDETRLIARLLKAIETV
jgi:uncharacterized protein (TIGR00730 family)